MLKEIKLQEIEINKLLKVNNPKTDWDAVMDYHITKIHFFQHERQIHLFVTLSIGLFTLITSLGALIANNIYLFVVVILFLVLLIPYIIYYMKLENAVQGMYQTYEKLIKHIAAF